MGEILRNWIQARLGILIDLTPDVFGHYAKDGRLLAEIMHSYDAISRGQLDTIVHTRDPALCRVNLKHLKVWLRFVGVECDDQSVEEISCGKGTSSLRLFYKLYLCLETKDMLHFITLQNEREKYVPSSKKFEVSLVCEKPIPYRPPEHPLSKKLAKGKDVVEWHRSKFASTLRKIRVAREMAEADRPVSVADDRPPLEDRCERTEVGNAAEESRELDRFALERRVRKTPEDHLEARPTPQDPRMARIYVDRLKGRRKRAATASALKARVQRAVFSELWERIAARQEEAVDREIAARVLDQSKYEKRMLTKLCEVREEKNAMAENRKLVEDITLEATEVEHRANYELAKDLASTEQKETETECRRMCELRQRLLAAKIEKIRKRHWILCRRVVEDLATIATNLADHRRLNDGHAPPSLLAEWTSLFLGCLPIFAEEVPCAVAHSADDYDEEQGRAFKSVADPDSEAMESLRDTLLDDYLERNAPWNEPREDSSRDADAIETSELGRLVLGYVAHRLLDHLYARPPNRAHSLLHKLKNVVVVLGTGISTVREPIAALLADSGIRLIRMEDAINHCLERYKQEMSDFRYIDSAVAATTARLIRGLDSPTTGKQPAGTSVSSSKDPRGGDRSRKSSRPSPSTVDEEGESNTREKETQTPRNIPYDDADPVLTDTAYMGKWAYDFLTLGEPIPDELATKILIEYLDEASAAKGLALFEYPATYEQMRLLEASLTGCSPPADPKAVDLRELTIEDIEAESPRIAFEDASDPFAAQRRSRLVPDPIATRDQPVSNRPFAALFVRVAQQPKHFERGEATYEAVAEDAPSIDKYYASRGIARILYYATFDPATLKTLARLLMGEASRRKMSDELFGDTLKSFEHDAKRGPSAKQAVVRRLVTEDEAFELELYRRSSNADDDDDDDDDDDEGEEVDEEETAFVDDFPLETGAWPTKPGTPDWQWIDFPLPLPLFESLARLWEEMERIYADELRELLLLKSLHASSVAPYVELVTRNAREFATRPDERQTLLRQFHVAFNAVDPDARNDAEVKCELHRRVADFQAELWRICDERRRLTEDERRRYAEDHWTLREAVILYNAYAGIVQAETDRFVDTMRLLQDYYLGMLRKPLQDSSRAKFAFPRVDVAVLLDEVDAATEKAEEGRASSSSSPPPPLDRKKKERTKASKVQRSDVGGPTVLEIEPLRKEIYDALIDDVEPTRLLDAIHGNVRYAGTVVDAIASTANELIKRELAAATAGRKDVPTDSGDSLDAKLTDRGEDLATEWRYAAAYEIERVRLQLDAIVAVARNDVAFLLDAMRRAFRGIREFTLDRYWREMKSANEATNVFCFAIEEGTMLEAEMLLDGDRFVVRTNVFATELSRPDRSIGPRERPEGERFRVGRLARLLDTLGRVAPYGTIGERAFVYILQDLASHGREEGETMALPCSWYRLRASDVSELVARVFGRVDQIEWREFLVYALDLPMPSCRELLTARDRFRVQDPELKELVTRAQFHRTPLWFLDRTADAGCPAYRRFVRSVLADDEFHRDWEELFEEELRRFDLPIGGKCSSADVPMCPDEETFRRVLAKELLCRMYSVDRQSVNYTALLLAFCKHRDPRVGFGKALALAIGNRVCTDHDDGERYAAELSIHRKRLEADDAEERLSYLGVERSFAAENGVADAYHSIGNEETAGEETSRDSLWERLAKEHDAVVYWISLDLCLTVLAAALPWTALKPDLIGGASLRDALLSVFRELEDPELDDRRKNVALIHRLLRHPFFDRVFASVAKFTAVDMGNTVLEILRAGETEKSG